MSCSKERILEPPLFFCRSSCTLTHTCGHIWNLTAEGQYVCPGSAVKAVRMDDMTYTELQEVDSHPLVSLLYIFLSLLWFPSPFVLFSVPACLTLSLPSLASFLAPCCMSVHV